ncbi:MAG: NAD(+) synthase, partial [Planctomyces sp.]
QILNQIAPANLLIVVCLLLPIYITNGVYNAACLICDGAIAGFALKQHLAGDGLHYEPRWFRAWPSDTVSEYHRDGSSWPVGDLIFDIDDVRIGFEICEDAWVASRPGNRMAERGVDVILNPSASHFAFGKHVIRRRFVLEGSRSFGVSYVYANLVGNEAGRAIYDGGALIASSGQMIASGPRFGFHQTQLTVADVNVDLTRTRRASIHSMRSDVTDKLQDRVVSLRNRLTPPEQLTETFLATVLESRPDEFTQAMALALFDYMRKSRSCGFVVSMSGGADSSALACLIRCMVERGISELGVTGFLRQLDYFLQIQNESNIDGIMKQLFTGVYQSTRNSGEVTLNAAEGVTRAVGGTFYLLDVDSLVQQYTSLIETAIGRQLTWTQDDVTLQNIQARTRSPSVWMLANLRNALLLATSNRSEAAVGYATMDGDTSGGLSPIAGIDKAFLREWLSVMETDGAGGCTPIPELKLVNSQQPTAELRPAEFHQTDEKDLMPYPLLDQIERLAIRDKLNPAEVLETLVRDGSPWSRTQLIEWIRRFFRLWSRNQWKRERYAPSFHVDDKNLDPKTWCRFPILSGGFEKELKDLN